MRKVLLILLWIWQLPQNLLGLAFMLFLRPLSSRDEKTIRHEGIGHPRQSRMLGPLYLLVIGLPSLLHAAFNGVLNCCDRHPEGYYHFYTEKWADRLGGVKR